MLATREPGSAQEQVGERGLECVIGQRHIVVPLRFVDQLIEYPRAALPLARQGVAGLGVYQGTLLVSLSLGVVRSAAVATKSVLLRGLAPSVTFALEVDQTLSFVDLLPAGAVTIGAAPSEPWLSEMTSSDGRRLSCLDVEALISAYIHRGIGA